MEHLVVVTYPEPLSIQARAVDHESVNEGNVGLAYYYDDHMIARGVVDSDAIPSIRSLLSKPVMLALAATEDEGGNIEGRVCLVLPVEGDAPTSDADGESEPWRASVPPPPDIGGSSYEEDVAGEDEDDERPRMALLPIGNVVRGSKDRNHPGDVAADATEMLRNLLAGKAKDAVQKAIDDLLDSI